MILLFQLSSIILCYLIGSIPAAYIVVKMIKGIDIRKHGSGNVGATNVLRLAGKKWFVVALVCDIGKGYIPVLAVTKVFRSVGGGIPLDVLQILCVFAVISGHTWPVFLKFKGGKGVATSTGAFFAMVPDVMAGTAVVWLVVIFITKIVSISSIIGAIAFTIFLFIFKKTLILKIFGILLALLVIYKHKSNIHRLLNGTEPKIGEKSHNESND